MYPFRNILFPSDFSTNARVALKYAAAFARNGHGRVVMFNVQSSKVPADLLQLPASRFAGPNRQWLSDLRSAASTFISDPCLHSLDVELRFAEGEPAAEIARAAVDDEIDLMTVVTPRRKRFSREFFGGSMAEEIIAESPCAVLALRPQQREFIEDPSGQTRINLKRILLATNFRPSSVAATLLATQIANHMGAELNAVYVIGDYFEQISVMFPEGGLAALTRLRSYVEERMAQLARTSRSRALTHIAQGRPYEEIVKLASKTETDLIVIGTAVHNSLFGGTTVLGSEIERVIRNAPCPVMCVPAARVVTPLPAFVTQTVPT